MTPEEAQQILAGCRERIDVIDSRIVELLNERTHVVERIGQVKQEMGFPVYEPRREDEVYLNVTSKNKGPMPGEAVKRVFERIIDEMRTVQREKMRRAKMQGSTGANPAPDRS